MRTYANLLKTIRNSREEPPFSLPQALEAFDFYPQQSLKCDKQIEEALLPLACPHLDLHNKKKDQGCLKARHSNLDTPKDYRSQGNGFYFDPLDPLEALNKGDTTKIPRIEAPLAVKILRERGRDMKKGKSEKHFTSWRDLTPENKIGGGKPLNGRTKTSSNRAPKGFCLAAFSLYRSQTVFGGFLRRLKAKQGAPKVMTTPARKIAVLFYSLLTKGTEYGEAELRYSEERDKRVLKSVQKQAHESGGRLTPCPPKKPAESQHQQGEEHG